MLTREAFVAVDMNVQRPLQRSSWKAEAIRRGDIKISGPIPIVEDVPSNEEEEIKLIEKGSFDGSLQPQEAMDQQTQRPETPPVLSGLPLRVSGQPSALRSNPVENNLAPANDISQYQSSGSQPRSELARELRPASIIVEPATSPIVPRATESDVKAAQKKKRKSGLRNVFRKMFGRKSRDESVVLEEEPVRKGHSYHHSDPGMLSQSSPKMVQGPIRNRISDLTVQEPKPPHPLGQHLPFPMNVNAPQASPPQEYLTFDLQRPRRVTLPGSKIQRHSLDEPRGRLAIWDEKQDDESLPSPEIGVAFSSPTQANPPTKSNRRSRSASALRDLAKGRQSIERRRSAEIRYWRASFGSGSLYSRPETAKTVETVRNVHAQEPTIRERGSESVLEMSATLVHVDDEEVLEQRETEQEVEAPASAFNFGNLKSGLSEKEDTPEVVDTAKVPPTPLQTQDRLMEDRVQHLENKYDNLESSMRRLSTRHNRHTIILENAPKTLRSRDRSSSARSDPTSQSHQDSTRQPNSDTLVVRSPSPELGGDGDELSHYTLKSMYETLKHERSARKALEKQVMTLQQDVFDLHALINRLVASATATSPSYPTPSPDTLITSTENRLTPKPMGTKSLELPHAKDREDVRASAISKFSYSETGSESGNEEEPIVEKPSAKGSFDELASPDIWATPREEQFAGNGFFFPRGKKSRDDMKGFI